MNTLDRAKYRAKRIDNGEWELFSLGDATYSDGEFMITCYSLDGFCQVELDTETVGQFTGLKDKAGAEIFEGDIVSSDFYLPNMESVALIEFVTENNNAAFCFKSAEQDAFYFGQLTIIGNIHDNPELLEATS